MLLTVATSVATLCCGVCLLQTDFVSKTEVGVPLLGCGELAIFGTGEEFYAVVFVDFVCHTKVYPHALCVAGVVAIDLQEVLGANEGREFRVGDIARYT